MIRVTHSTIKAGNSNGSEGRKHGEYNQSYQDILSAYFLPTLSLALRSMWPTSHVSGNVTNNAGKGQCFLPHDVYYCDEDTLTCQMNPKKLQFVTQASLPNPGTQTMSEEPPIPPINTLPEGQDSNTETNELEPSVGTPERDGSYVPEGSDICDHNHPQGSRDDANMNSHANPGGTVGDYQQQQGSGGTDGDDDGPDNEV